MLGKALNAGEELKNSATWKKHQQALNAILTIFGFVVLFMPEEIKQQLSPGALNSIGEAVVIIGGIVNSYLTPATSKKIGLAK